MKKKMLPELRPVRYVNPYTDFGFKMLFGSEVNKELLISFVNSLFNGKEVIMNHRQFFAECDISRSWMPYESYVSL